MTEPHLPQEFIAFLQTLKGKRSRVVVEHILKHGYITTEDLEQTYGYSHPPRAVRDVREQGVPIETFTVKNAQGRSIAAYRFDDPTLLRSGRAGGRGSIPKAIKSALLAEQDNKCAIYVQRYDERVLQVDHRIPYEVSAQLDTPDDTFEYMLLCGSCNRAKSWMCEHCENWHTMKDAKICRTCYWAFPISYLHIAMQPIRRIELVWSDQEVSAYEQLKQLAELAGVPLSDFLKTLLNRSISPDDKNPQ